MSLKHHKVSLTTREIDHYFLCYYKRLSSGYDRLSKSLIHFKQGVDVDVRAWTSVATELVPPVIEGNNLIVIRSLSSNEVEIDRSLPTALDYLGSKLADACSGTYAPNLLRKKRVTRPMKLLSLSERAEEIKDVYYVSDGKSVSNLLLVDDIFTTGNTVKSIAEAMLDAYPGITISVFTLALSDLVTSTVTQDLQSPSFRWHQGSGWMAQEEAESYPNLKELERAIRNDVW